MIATSFPFSEFTLSPPGLPGITGGDGCVVEMEGCYGVCLGTGGGSNVFGRDRAHVLYAYLGVPRTDGARLFSLVSSLFLQRLPFVAESLLPFSFVSRLTNGTGLKKVKCLVRSVFVVGQRQQQRCECRSGARGALSVDRLWKRLVPVLTHERDFPWPFRGRGGDVRSDERIVRAA